jgi:hypothetical protein
VSAQDGGSDAIVCFDGCIADGKIEINGKALVRRESRRFFRRIQETGNEIRM